MKKSRRKAIVYRERNQKAFSVDAMNNHGILKLPAIELGVVTGGFVHRCEHDLLWRNVYHENIELTISMFTRGKS